MTIQEYWDVNNKGWIHSLVHFTFAEEFTCWIHNGKVYMEEYSEGEFELKHIKTIDDYRALYKVLMGINLKIK